MVNSLLREKANELDSNLLDLVTAEINDAISTLRITLHRAAETLNVSSCYLKPFIDRLYEEVKELVDG